MKSATIYDVADRAGVSHQTVSRVLRGFEGIRPATRAKVLAALEQLDYKPNGAARLLRTQRVNRIGVLVHAIDQSGPGRTLAGAARCAQRHGYVLDIVPMDGDDPNSIGLALALAAEHQIAGIIATARTASVDATLKAQARSLAVVTEATTAPDGFEMTHDEAIGAIAADHLLELGHRKVGYLGGPTSWVAAVDRYRGFQQRIERAGGSVEWSGVGDWSAESGFQSVADLLSQGSAVTAIATANDSTAIGVIAGLSARGRRVPEDFSVIGTDDIPEARYHIPSLSTVALDFEGEGERLVEQLLVDIGEIPEASSTPRPPMLVARSSTAPCSPDRSAAREVGTGQGGRAR